MRYSVQPRDRIFARGYGFLPFAKSMDKNIGKNISKKTSAVNIAENFLIMLKNPQQMRLKLLQKEQFKKQFDLIGNKIADRIRKVSKKSQQNNSEKVTNEHDKEMPKERYISPEKRQEIINDLRLT